MSRSRITVTPLEKEHVWHQAAAAGFKLTVTRFHVGNPYGSHQGISGIMVTCITVPCQRMGDVQCVHGFVGSNWFNKNNT